ncbi:MAG: lanthionine synthetase LanC family protein [Thermoanaerobaculia bacterium]|nr:lanthionine synthetase LanC family protein [Thermoanaerobaculia bacterium]
MLSRLDRLLATVEIGADGAVRVAGEPVRPEDFDPASRGLPLGVPGADPRLGALAARLYDRFYCRDGAPLPSFEPGDVAGFTAALSAARGGSDRWEPGWTVASVSANGQVVATKHGRTVELWPGQYLLPRGGGPPQPGLALTAYFPKESATYQPGFFFTWSTEPPDRDEPGTLLRLYWHVSAAGAPELLARLTERLDRFQVPFRFKTLAVPGAYGRLDAAVLFVARRFFPVVASVAAELHGQVAGFLGQAVPLFTKPLAPGLGLAEDPGHGESFGTHRCRLVAEALLRQPHGDRRATVAAWFGAYGLDLARPWLNPGSVDGYALPTSPPRSPSPHRPRTPDQESGRQEKTQEGSEQDRYLAVADGIGARLCRDALWDGQRVNWLGDSSEFVAGAWRVVHKACGPDLYGGLAGIGLFLARLATAVAEPRFGETARAALLSAVALESRFQGSQGFYAGRFGLAWALHEVGSRLADEELLEHARRLLSELAAEEPAAGSLDIVSGSAGLLAAALDLARKTGDPALLPLARRHGEHLLRTIEIDGDAGSWPTLTPLYVGMPNLTGFSHGAGGIAWALLELAEVTGDERFRTAARLGHAYERRAFDAAQSNWPDFRGTHPGPDGRPRFACGNAWCHGAPGLAPARARCAELTGDSALADEARLALRTTLLALRQALATPGADFSLCHGLAGNARCAADAEARLGEPGEAQEAALAVARHGLERYHDDRAPWPCGIQGGGENPSLMVGTAGIGLFYLGLARPELGGSVLLVG